MPSKVTATMETEMGQTHSPSEAVKDLENTKPI